MHNSELVLCEGKFIRDITAVWIFMKEVLRMGLLECKGMV